MDDNNIGESGKTEVYLLSIATPYLQFSSWGKCVGFIKCRFEAVSQCLPISLLVHILVIWCSVVLDDLFGRVDGSMVYFYTLLIHVSVLVAGTLKMHHLKTLTLSCLAYLVPSHCGAVEGHTY